MAAVAALVLLSAGAAATQPQDMPWVVPVVDVLQIVGGDTIKARVSPWPRTWKTAVLRLARIDCIRGMEEASATFTADALLDSPRVLVAPMGPAPGGRVYCEIFYEKDGAMRRLSDDLLSAGLAQAGHSPSRP